MAADQYNRMAIFYTSNSQLRHLFNVLVFKSIEALYRHMASLYRLQIE